MNTFTQIAYNVLEKTMQLIVENIINAKVEHFNESVMYVDKKRGWLNVAGIKLLHCGKWKKPIPRPPPQLVAEPTTITVVVTLDYSYTHSTSSVHASSKTAFKICFLKITSIATGYFLF